MPNELSISLDAGKVAELLGIVLAGWKSKRITKAIKIASRDFPEGVELRIKQQTVEDLVTDIWAVAAGRSSSTTITKLLRDVPKSKRSDVERALAAVYGDQVTGSIKVAAFLAALGNHRTPLQAPLPEPFPSTVQILPGAPKPGPTAPPEGNSGE